MNVLPTISVYYLIYSLHVHKYLKMPKLRCSAGDNLTDDVATASFVSRAQLVGYCAKKTLFSIEEAPGRHADNVFQIERYTKPGKACRGIPPVSDGRCATTPGTSSSPASKCADSTQRRVHSTLKPSFRIVRLNNGRVQLIDPETGNVLVASVNGTVQLVPSSAILSIHSLLLASEFRVFPTTLGDLRRKLCYTKRSRRF
eukprot:scpid92973/ scgid31059/ 